MIKTYLTLHIEAPTFPEIPEMLATQAHKKFIFQHY